MDIWVYIFLGPPLSERNGVRIYKKMYKNYRIYCLRGCTTIRVPPQEVYELVTDLNRRKEWDDLYKKGRIVETLGEGVQVLYMAWKSPSILVNNRDFVTLRVERKDADPSVPIISMMRSIVHKDIPTQKVSS